MTFDEIQKILKDLFLQGEKIRTNAEELIKKIHAKEILYLPDIVLGDVDGEHITFIWQPNHYRDERYSKYNLTITVKENQIYCNGYILSFVFFEEDSKNSFNLSSGLFDYLLALRLYKTMNRTDEEIETTEKRIGFLMQSYK